MPVLLVLLVSASGCVLLEPSGCKNVGIDFEPAETVGPSFVDVTTASLQRDAPDLAPHALSAASGNANSVHVSEQEYSRSIRGQLLAVDPDRTMTWVHPDGAVRVGINMC